MKTVMTILMAMVMATGLLYAEAHRLLNMGAAAECQEAVGRVQWLHPSSSRRKFHRVKTKSSSPTG